MNRATGYNSAGRLRQGLTTATQRFNEPGRPTLALAAAGVGEFEWNIARDEWAVSQRMARIAGYPAGTDSIRHGEALLHGRCAVTTENGGFSNHV